MQDLSRYRKLLEKLIDTGQEIKILTLISRLHPDDIADLIDALGEEKKSLLFRLLDIETASDVLVALDDISRELILEDISEEKLTEIIDDLPSDDAADLIADLSRDQAKAILRHIDQEKSEGLQKLLEYPEESAGGIMQTELVSAHQDKTVREVVEIIRSRNEVLEDLHNVFVVDDAAQLVGVVPLRKLILAPDATPVSQIMDRSVVCATVEQDQEEIAALFKKYDLISLPVVDRDKRIIGRITVDDIIDVIEEEDSEDILRMAGISKEEDIVYSGATLKVCFLRLPWLIFNFFGTLASGYFLWLYQSSMPDLLALLAFVPVICAMSGNMGVQSSSIVIRGLATGRVDMHNLRRTIVRECVIGLVIGSICGGIGGAVGLLWQRSFGLGIVVSVSMFIAIAFGGFMGVIVPLFFKKINIDPAVASGALITTANDLVALNIYFLLAALLSRNFLSMT